MYSPKGRRSHPRKALQTGFFVTGILLIAAFVLQTGALSISRLPSVVLAKRPPTTRDNPRFSPPTARLPVNPFQRDDYERFLLERYVGMRLDSMRYTVPYDTMGADTLRWKLLAEVRKAVKIGAFAYAVADSGRWMALEDSVLRAYEEKVDSIERVWGDSVRLLRFQDSLRWAYEEQLDSTLDAWQDSLRIQILQESIRTFQRRRDSAATDTGVASLASVPPTGPLSGARTPGGSREFVNPAQGVGLLLSILVLCAFACFAGALYLAVASSPSPVAAGEGARHALPRNGLGSFLLRGGFATGGILLLLLAITPVIACTLVVPPPKRVVQIALLYVSGAVGFGFLWLRYHEFETTNDILQWISSAVALPNLIAAVLLPE